MREVVALSYAEALATYEWLVNLVFGDIPELEQEVKEYVIDTLLGAQKKALEVFMEMLVAVRERKRKELHLTGRGTKGILREEGNPYNN